MIVVVLDQVDRMLYRCLRNEHRSHPIMNQALRYFDLALVSRRLGQNISLPELLFPPRRCICPEELSCGKPIAQTRFLEADILIERCYRFRLQLSGPDGWTRCERTYKYR